jgi:hypothetical protein
MLPNYMAILMIDEHIYRKNFYKQCANRFRPFDAVISRLFATLAAEEEEQRQELMPLLYEALENDTLSVKPSCGAMQPQKTEDHSPGLENFFVINNAMARTLLQAALEMEYETYDFYGALCTNAKNHPFLGLFFERLNFFIDNHRQVLEEAIGRFDLQTPSSPQSRAKIPVILN